jgi:hypothetical protein
MPSPILSTIRVLDRDMEPPSAEHACGFDRSELHSDEGPPIGEVSATPWDELALEIAVWVLRWN